MLLPAPVSPIVSASAVAPPDVPGDIRDTPVVDSLGILGVPGVRPDAYIRSAAFAAPARSDHDAVPRCGPAAADICNYSDPMRAESGWQ